MRCVCIESDETYIASTKKEDWYLILRDGPRIVRTGKLEVVKSPADLKFTTLAEFRKKESAHEARQ